MTFSDEKAKFIKTTKLIIKSNLSKNIVTLESYRQKIIQSYNELTNYCRDQYPKLNSESKELIILEHKKLKEKLCICLTLLNCVYTIENKPLALLTESNVGPPAISETTSEENSSTEHDDNDNDSDNIDDIHNEININNEMATTTIQFLSFAGKTIPEFDGSPENLQRFTDALNLVNANVETHMNSAVQLAKTKLIGTARNFITNEATLEAIIETLKNNIKGESTKAVIAKIMSVKQLGKSPTSYIKELEELTTSLKRAYITDGVPATLADEYATQNAVVAMTKNATNEKVKLIMEAGHFDSMNDAVAKYVGTTSEHTGVSVLYANRSNRGRGANYYYRGNNYYNRGNGHQSRGYYNRGNYTGNSQNYNRNARGYNRGNYRGRGQQQIRAVEQGNQPVPQHVRLGDANVN